MAERLAHLDAVIKARLASNNNNNNNKHHGSNNPYNAGGFLPTDVQILLLDYLQGSGSRARQMC